MEQHDNNAAIPLETAVKTDGGGDDESPSTQTTNTTPIFTRTQSWLVRGSIAVLIVCAVLLAGFEFEASEPRKTFRREPRIIDGELYRPLYKHPVVLIRTHHVAHGRHKAGTCTGTILNSRYILTAGHCFTENNMNNKPERKNIKDITIYIGIKSIRQLRMVQYYGASNIPTSQVIKLTKIKKSNVIIHSGWFHTLDYKRQQEAKLSDIALLKLDQVVDFVKTNTRPVKLFAPAVGGNKNWYPQERNSIAVGWGLTRWPDSGKDLKVAGIRTKNLNWCINKSNEMGFRPKTMTIPDVFCGHGKIPAYGGNRPQICFGDSGGPLFLKHENGLTQVGINVWVDRTCSQNFNGFLRINEHINWIKRNVKAGNPLDIISFQNLDVDITGKSDEELMRHFDYDGGASSANAELYSTYDSGILVDDDRNNSSADSYSDPYNLDSELNINLEDDYDVPVFDGGASMPPLTDDNGNPILIEDFGSSIFDTQDPFQDRIHDEKPNDWETIDGEPSFVDHQDNL